MLVSAVTLKHSQLQLLVMSSESNSNKSFSIAAKYQKQSLNSPARDVTTVSFAYLYQPWPPAEMDARGAGLHVWQVSLLQLYFKALFLEGEHKIIKVHRPVSQVTCDDQFSLSHSCEPGKQALPSSQDKSILLFFVTQSLINLPSVQRLSLAAYTCRALSHL